MELRLYSFVNFYLSSIQQGIQTGHAAVDLVRKYASDGEEMSAQQDLVKNWADNHKTFITLNGGNNAGILASYDIISKSGFPFVTFHEDEQSLGGIMTCVAVVLPETIFNARWNRAEDKQSTSFYEYVDPETGVGRVYLESDVLYPLVDLVKKSRLAS